MPARHCLRELATIATAKVSTHFYVYNIKIKLPTKLITNCDYKDEVKN